MASQQIVIGLTGPNASGKGEVAAYLRQRGYTIHSLSDLIREEAARRGLPPEREHLIRIGNLLRREGGASVLARRLRPRLGRRAVVDSIRNPAEVEELRRLPRFVLLGVRATVEQRFARSKRRARPGDPRTLEEFREREQQENSTNPEAQQLDATLGLADRVVDNDAGLPLLHQAIDRLLSEYEAAATSGAG